MLRVGVSNTLTSSFQFLPVQKAWLYLAWRSSVRASACQPGSQAASRAGRVFVLYRIAIHGSLISPTALFSFLFGSLGFLLACLLAAKWSFGA